MAPNNTPSPHWLDFRYDVSMSKYYDHNLWHERKIKEISRSPFRYRMAQNFFICDALSYANSPSAPCRLLDLGCGLGDISKEFSSLGFDVTGLELSEVAHKHSLNTPAGVSFIKGDILEADKILSGNWEFVTAFNVLHCIVQKQDRRRFLAVVKSLLKPGGSFYACSMCGLPGAAIMEETGIDPYTRVGSNGTRLHLDSDAILSEFSEAGFKVLEHRLFENIVHTEQGVDLKDISLLATTI
jgi:2-polyprenyl-3-methyl-5-hydroxy-6-metoxy-1,4-benzoquinol methylase